MLNPKIGKFRNITPNKMILRWNDSVSVKINPIEQFLLVRRHVDGEKTLNWIESTW